MQKFCVQIAGTMAGWHENNEECSPSARPSPNVPTAAMLQAMSVARRAESSCTSPAAPPSAAVGVQLFIQWPRQVYCTSPQPSSRTPASLIRTHVYQRNPAGLLVHLMRQYNPTGLSVRSQGCTYNPTGLPVRSQEWSLTLNPNTIVALCHMAPILCSSLSFS